MKRIVLTLALAMSLTFATAQRDLSINLTSPAAGATLGPGIGFNFDVTITNLGSQPVTTSDTLLYFPLLNGNLLQVIQNGDTIPLVFPLTGLTMNNGDSQNRSINFAGLSIDNGTATNIDFCGGVVAVGPNWSGFGETDTTNNVSCANVAFDPNGGGTIGLNENVLFSEISLPLIDGSYSDGSTYFLRVYNLQAEEVTLSFVDLTGRTVSYRRYNANGSELSQDIELTDMPNGILLAVLSVDGQQINAKKIFVK